MSQDYEYKEQIDWMNTLFMIVSPIAAVAGLIYLFVFTDGLHTKSIILFLIFTLTTGLAITAGYHRLFSHRTYQAHWSVKLFLLIFGAAAFENSCLKWCSDHRVHHQFTDKERDPYNIQRGFWYAHMGWILKIRIPYEHYDNVRDLQRDPWVMWQDRFYTPLALTFGFALPAAIGAIWGDMLGAFILAGLFRLVINHHFTFFINSLCHMVGRRPYSDRNTSRDNWFMSLLTYGEGYHNFHHSFPTDYRNGVRKHQWDPSKWLIALLERCGLVWGLRRVPEAKILKARLAMEEKELLAKIERKALRQQISAEIIVNAREKVEQAYANFRERKEEYKNLKKQKLIQMHEQVSVMKAEIKQAKLAFKEACAAWLAVMAKVEYLSRRPTAA